MRAPGHSRFRRLPTPVIVPPVPAAHTNASSFPSVCSRISTAVVSAWASGLSSLPYWSRMCAFGRMALRCRATLMWLSGASKAASVGVRMISAPSASRTTCFSRLIFSGIVMIIR